MRKFTTLVLTFFLAVTLFAQTPEEKEKAVQLCLDGIAEMDKGEIEKAMVFFEQAKKLDPDNIHYPFEIAHSYFLTRNYKKAIPILENLMQHKDVTDRVYNLLGNSYEYNKNEKKAEEIYKSGIERFPSSGVLYHSLGKMSLEKELYKEALDYFEKGIKAEPSFTSNYYWASKVHASLEDKLWGIIFAELYINMEGVNEQSAELSRMIYDVYEKGINVSGANSVIDIADADTTGKNFEHEVETQLLFSVKKINEPLSTSSLYKIRKDFIQNWVENGKHDTYPNLLFDWHKTLLLKDYLEVYHYWLFKEVNPSEFEKYKDDHLEIYNNFIEWLSENHLQADKSEFFVSEQYSR